MTIVGSIKERYHRASVRTKLNAVVVVSFLCAYAVLSVALSMQYLSNENDAEARRYSTELDVVANSLVSALMFMDVERATEALSKFSLQPSIISAELFDRKGSAVAQYGFEGSCQHPDICGHDGPEVESYGMHLVMRRPVVLENEHLGRLVVVVNIKEGYLLALKRLTLLALIMTLALGVTLAVVNRLQGRILIPVERLATAMGYVSMTRDYAHRLPVETEDEFGLLSAQFNEMLGRIAHHDEALARELQLRTAAEGHLKDSERKFRALFDSAGDGIVLYAPHDGTVVLANESIQRMLGPSLAGKLMAELLPAHAGLFERASPPPAIPGVQIAQEGDDHLLADVRLTKIELEGTAYVLATFRDVTEQRRMEETIQRIANLESLGMLAGGIAHDLNNKLSIVLNNVFLAKAHLNPENPARAKLDEIERTFWQVTGLTKQLLTFAKGDTLQKKTLSVSALLEETVRFSCTGSKALLVIDIAQDLKPVDIDPGRMTQVLNNLVINALQAMPEGGTLTVEARNEHITSHGSVPLPEGDYINICISDTGPGIPRELLAKIFSPYFTTKRTGHGLGLAMSASIVERHAGLLTASNVPVGGAAFLIHLPASKLEVSKVDSPHEMPDIKGTDVLVMDDEAGVRNSLVELLVALGCKVSAVSDGALAVESYAKRLASGKPFDLAVLDLTVPGGVGGKEAALSILGRDPQARVLLATAYSEDDVVVKHEAYGIRGVVLKPYQAHEIAWAIKRCALQNGKAARGEHPIKARVLIVDDEMLLSAVTAQILKEMGHDVVDCVIDAEGVRKALTSARADVVLLDANLNGEMEGIEIAREINKISDASVVFMSGHSAGYIRENATGVRYEAILTKPVEEALLRGTLQEVLSKRAKS